MTKIAISHLYIADRSRERHPRIAELLERNGVLDASTQHSRDLFMFLARTVVGQQLSTAAAGTIWTRVTALQEVKSSTLQGLLLRGDSIEIITSCGVSKAKAKALCLLAQTFRQGEMSYGQIRDLQYDKLVESITALWGFGRWSADMVAMFFLGMPDVWPEQDVALARGLRMLVPDEDPAELSTHYSPERTYLARHVWNGLDSGLIGEIQPQ